MGSSLANPLVLNLNKQIEQGKVIVLKCTKVVENVTKYKLLEKCLRALEESEKFGITDAKSLGLVLNLIMPSMFKALNFDKYNGTTDPIVYIRMYCQKMASMKTSRNY